MKKLVFLICMCTVLSSNSIFAQSTSGNCSPHIERTGGNVIVRCGKADLKVEFLLSLTQAACKDFKEKMTLWNQETAARGWISNENLPLFITDVVEDVKANKTVIYEYDKSDFVRIYLGALSIGGLYVNALNYRGNDNKKENALSRKEKKYFGAVDRFCRWSGYDLNLKN